MLSIIKPLVVNITILFSLTFNANLFFPFRRERSFLFQQRIIYGIIGSFASFLCMIYPIETLGETNFDLRMLVIIITTLYGGLIPGVICTSFSILFRLFVIGGSFATVGLLVTVLAFVVAIIFRRAFFKSEHKLLFSSLILVSYMVPYITIIYFTIDFLSFHFYLIYFFSFTITYFSLILVIERMIVSNQHIEEAIYLDKLATVSQMAASFAHEVRNPITTVRGFIQFLGEDTKDQQFKKYYPVILEELDRTNKIVTDYLTLSKPTKFELEVVDLNEVLHNAIDLLQPLAAYQNVKLSLNISQAYRVNADKSHLKQALLNLVKNGIESISEKGYVNINVTHGKNKETVEIIIEDSGKGMTREELEKIGLPYYTTKTKGTGLGSMISNRLIREMNGKIQYDSNLNTGTKVTIILPCTDYTERKQNL
ncbi:two-component system sporulation sensor kinase B [Bacillus mesophilus]|uniref:histidine kinase n=1 Tax=Bacillus mesophilus TaxID=1808955 RepID=A0A6M0Q2D6_9BACI|nr:ATP-binding protein [Bacillus mesophilus]MBM7659576.1 two-component system sporulation sensor kinase B [Bacillus mesophilus]NEY70447.1 two-component sensor histidine kinase [Bacillus mesophilus]